jgi:predicted PurR-regulated permease PerM
LWRQCGNTGFHRGFVDNRTAIILTPILLFAAAGAFIYLAGRVRLSSFFAVVFAFVLERLVSRLQRFIKPLEAFAASPSLNLT